MDWGSPENELVNSSLKANKPKMGIRGKDVLKRPRKPKEFSNKLMGVKRGKKEVNGPRKPEEWSGKTGWHGRNVGQ